MHSHRSSSVLAVAFVAGLSPAQAPQPVRVALVQRIPLAEHVRVTGSLRAASEAVLAAREEGAILEVAVREADQVESGAVLARTDGRRLQAQVREAEADLGRVRAELAQRQAELTNAEADLAAMTAAAEDNAVSQRQLRTARTEAAVARARVAAAETQLASITSRLDLLRVRLDDTTLRAPFAGRVTVRHTEPGEWLRPGDPVVTLTSRGIVQAWLEVPERLAATARDLAALPVGVDGTGAEVSSLALRVVPVVHPRARTFHLVADLAEQDGALMPGMSVSAWVPAGPAEPRLVVPRDALVRRTGMVAVYVVQGQGAAAVARMVPVQVQFESPQGVALQAGAQFAEGATVVIEGNERLFDGAPVTVATDAPRVPAPAPAGEHNGAGKEDSAR